MSIRNKWADIFWFTFFHEVCHLLKHRAQRRILIDGLDADPDSAGIEAEADRFAEDLLIPPQDWDAFRAEDHFTPSAVQSFARSVDIAPFIVVERLQKEGLVRYGRLASLKRRYEWVTDTDG